MELANLLRQQRKRGATYEKLAADFGWESEDGCAWSATCSRCGCTAMSHDMRNAP